MQSTWARVGVVAALAAVAVVLFVVLSGDDDSDSDTETQAATTQETTATATTETSDESTTTIVFRNDKVVGGVEDIEVDRGASVTIVVDSDDSGDVHVHGYELEAPVESGESVQVGFTANLEGVFEVELHSHSTGEEVPLAELTVNP